MAVDIMTALDAVFNKSALDEYPTPFILHRFLASDPDYAVVAKAVQRTSSDSQMVFSIWRGALPKRSKAPRLGYVGPKKQKGAEALVAALMRLEHLRREEAEDVVELADKATIKKLEAYYGVE